jgi:predicted site-specific integrase-resolvase
MTETRINTRGSGNASLRPLAYALLVAVLAAFGLHAAFIAGSAMLAAAHEKAVRAVADEDRQFCERFGMRSGTDAFAACSRELSIVRQGQLDRDNAAALGIL